MSNAWREDTETQWGGGGFNIMAPLCSQSKTIHLLYLVRTITEVYRVCGRLFLVVVGEFWQKQASLFPVSSLPAMLS